jgi:hypothetical protein
MGKSFFLEVAVLGALGLAPQVAHAENAGSDAVGMANRSIVDARNNTKRALRNADNKVNDDVVNAQNRTKRQLNGAANKVNNDIVDTRDRVKRTVKGEP